MIPRRPRPPPQIRQQQFRPPGMAVGVNAPPFSPRPDISIHRPRLVPIRPPQQSQQRPPGQTTPPKAARRITAGSGPNSPITVDDSPQRDRAELKAKLRLLHEQRLEKLTAAEVNTVATVAAEAAGFTGGAAAHGSSRLVTVHATSAGVTPKQPHPISRAANVASKDSLETPQEAVARRMMVAPPKSGDSSSFATNTVSSPETQQQPDGPKFLAPLPLDVIIRQKRQQVPPPSSLHAEDSATGSSSVTPDHYLEQGSEATTGVELTRKRAPNTAMSSEEGDSSSRGDMIASSKRLRTGTGSQKNGDIDSVTSVLEPRGKVSPVPESTFKTESLGENLDTELSIPPTTSKMAATPILAAPQRAILATPQRAILATPQRAILATPQRAIPAAPQRAIPAAPQRAIPAAPQRAIPAAPQRAVPATPQRAVPAAPQRAIPAAPQRAILATPRRAMPAAPQRAVPRSGVAVSEVVEQEQQLFIEGDQNFDEKQKENAVSDLNSKATDASSSIVDKADIASVVVVGGVDSEEGGEMTDVDMSEVKDSSSDLGHKCEVVCEFLDHSIELPECSNVALQEIVDFAVTDGKTVDGWNDIDVEDLEREVTLLVESPDGLKHLTVFINSKIELYSSNLKTLCAMLEELSVNT